MALDPNTYIGFPDAELQFGTLVSTGLAGPSKVGDYQWAVFDQNGRELTDPNMILPPGTKVSFGYPASVPSASGGEVVTGTDLVEQAERIRRSQDESRIAQETLNAQRDAQASQDRLARDQMAQQQQQFDRQFAETMAQNQRRYELDKAILGEQTATRLFNERMAEASAKRDEQRLELQRQAQNFQMADTLAGRKMDILDMLAQRSGPQDWVAYDNLISGFRAPEARSSQTIDVFDTVRDLERQIAGLTGGQTGSASSAGSAPTFNVQQALQQQSAPQQPQTPQAPANPFGQAQVLGSTGNSQQPQQQPAQAPQGMDTGFSRLMGTGLGAASQGGGAMPQTLDIQKLLAGLKGLEHGGMMGGGAMAVTGESKSGQMNPEIVVNLNPDPKDRIAVIPVRQILDQLKSGGVPMAESGGIYGVGEQLGTGQYTFNDYSPETLRNLPVVRQLTGEMDTPAWSGFGATLQNRNLGISGFPDTINVRDFLNMNPSRQSMAADLYNRGLGVSFDDVLARSRAAAPIGATLPVSVYGR